MRLYNGMSPNGARVEIFLAEKKIEIPKVEIDVMKGDTQTPDYLKINSLGQVPVLELDDGTVITESVAICRYLETLHAEPALFGKGAKEQAQVEMWNRRIERHIFDTVGNIGMHEMPFFAKHIEQMPEYANSLRRRFIQKLSWLNNELSDCRPFVVGQSFSVADITGMAAFIICNFINQDVPSDFTHVKQWERNLRERTSWPTYEA